MARKLALLGTVIAAFAAFATPAAMPAVASAGPVFTDPPGVPLVPPVIIVYTRLSWKVTGTAIGTLECENWTFRTTLEKNSGTTIEEKGSSAEASGCTAGGAKVTITSPTVGPISTTGEGSGSISTSFVADVGAFQCPFAGSGAGPGYNPTKNSDVIHVTLSLTSSFSFCEEEEGEGEPAVLAATWTRETPNGTPIIMSE